MITVQIDVFRTPAEVAYALRMQKITACPLRSRLGWTAAFLCNAALMIPLPRCVLMLLLPTAEVYAYSDSFAEWRVGWASFAPPSETIDAGERRKFLDAIADILES